MLPSRFAALLMSLILTALLPGLVPAQAPDEARQQQEWLAIFEQSYGTEGLYVVEVYPRDEAGKTRLVLQNLNAAAQQFRAAAPGEAVSLEAMRGKLQLPDDILGDLDPGHLKWDAEKGLFTTDLGLAHTPGFGAQALLRGNELIHERIYLPDTYTRSRWQKIYKDPKAPEFLRREILLREFMLEHFYFREARQAEIIQTRLLEFEEACMALALSLDLSIGDTLTSGTIVDSGVLDNLEPLPEGTKLKPYVVGEPLHAMYAGMEITSDARSVMALRLRHAREVYTKHRGYPPAEALRARFLAPAEALKVLDAAIAQWPEVPGLRIERMTANARLGSFDAWKDDIGFILGRFPAAPLLLEIKILGGVSGLSAHPDPECLFALMVADVRPDLLAHQLHAIQVLGKNGRTAEAVTVYDRLVFANPAWSQVLARPVAPSP